MVPTESFSDAHFATFPTKLIEPMILAGCPAQVCSECRTPWERVVERETNWEESRAAGAWAGNVGVSNSYQNGVHGKGMSHDLGTVKSVDLGFRPTCSHDAPTRPGIVLDPFMGSGTTAVVARALKRNFIGCELNPKYIQMAQERLRLPFEQHYVERDNSVSDLPLFSGLD